MAELIAPIPLANNLAASPPANFAIFPSNIDTEGLLPLVYILLLNGSSKALSIASQLSKVNNEF